MSWENFKLHPKLVYCLEESGFETPTDIQDRSLIYTNYIVDLIIASRTGSGKTLAYVIPMLNHLFNKRDEDHKAKEEEKEAEVKEDTEEEEKSPCLVLFPTRELAI